ncbi:unnamed protein product [Periconia digitata]|uniref:Uncharacterized protein n=1 Tax=Periconia digitata TaxID=1303443 RepID=A0A9W4XN41_9PLEO|nr:unnamed protein product [Periconia digitata]
MSQIWERIDSSSSPVNIGSVHCAPAMRHPDADPVFCEANTKAQHHSTRRLVQQLSCTAKVTMIPRKNTSAAHSYIPLRVHRPWCRSKSQLHPEL